MIFCCPFQSLTLSDSLFRSVLLNLWWVRSLFNKQQHQVPFRPPAQRPPMWLLYFHLLTDHFCLWLCCYDSINMYYIGLKGLKRAFTPTSKYKNKHGTGESSTAVSFCGLGWPTFCAWNVWAQLWSFIVLSTVLIIRLLYGRCYFLHWFLFFPCLLYFC